MKNCENYNSFDDALIFVDIQVNLLCAQLKVSNWPEHACDLWTSQGVARLTAALHDHPHPKIFQHVISMRIEQLIKDVQNCPCVAKFSERGQNWEEKHQRLQMELIPSHFVRTCNTKMKELVQATQLHLPTTKFQG